MAVEEPDAIRDIQRIGVAGLGLLGRGISACLLAHTFEVVAFTRRESTRAEACEYIDQAIQDLIAYADFPSSLLRGWRGRYLAVDSCERFEGCDFVIESVAEDISVKQQVFDQIEAAVRPDVPVASNTSSFPVTRLQQGRKHPERFLGMHWAKPAHATRFIELVRGEQTSDAAFRKAVALAEAVGKEPSLVEKDVPAFIVNRLGYALYREALNLLELGVADVETIDRSCRNALGLWAALCGPFRWMDLTGGPALYAAAIERVLPTLSNAGELTERIKELAAGDARGTANRRGFYQYTEEEAVCWERLFRKHAWTIRDLMNEHFPLKP